MGLSGNIRAYKLSDTWVQCLLLPPQMTVQFPWIISAFLLIVLSTLITANDFAGANSYFLYALSVSALVDLTI